MEATGPMSINAQRNATGSNPPIKGGGKRKNRSDRRDQRRADAEERQAQRDARTAAEQLARLESRGFGRCREAVRLRAEVSS